MARCTGNWFVLVGICLGLADVAARSLSENENVVVRTPHVLDLYLTVSADLPPLTKRVLVRETDQIWRDARVELRWLPADTPPESGQALRVLVTTRAMAARAGTHWPVGELRRFDTRTAIAVASIASAERIVDESQAYQRPDVPTMREYRLGVVLGRAVAHEIGHYLLQSNAHSTYGLMRATIDAREFADLRTGAFRLDRESQASLAARALAARSE